MQKTSFESKLAALGQEAIRAISEKLGRLPGKRYDLKENEYVPLYVDTCNDSGFLYTLELGHDYEEMKQGSYGVFGTLGKAKEEFDRIVGNVRKEDEDEDYFVETDTDLRYEAYEDGYASRNHSYVWIEEVDVEEGKEEEGTEPLRTILLTSAKS